MTGPDIGYFIRGALPVSRLLRVFASSLLMSRRNSATYWRFEKRNLPHKFIATDIKTALTSDCFGMVIETNEDTYTCTATEH